MADLNYKDKYQKEIIPKLKESLGYKNNFAVPRVEKVVLSVGLGKLSQQTNFQEKILPEVIKNISEITGQKPKTTVAKKSIAGFKVREGQIIGVKVTLRGARMHDFIKKLVMSVFPRVRDFRGIDIGVVDKQGNLSVGFKENVVFPEINAEISQIEFGVEVTLVTKARKREEAIELYKLLGMPFKEKGEEVVKKKRKSKSKKI
ncbi:50S ribosomal protein L5 [Candidatus Wolfebacteria bacterium CG10_big_fil_rev_8_21_14_0_10_31_9]|uniref:Large ribosomal subunit protein uL5 n=1 Tax=Candidatus Wolfebacteria bacterium CG10_big_fil_rev_8_21_14_0_10_31_9 TaxID=1975070 RepID=A0A2H0RCP3_9BACT|nr:MAG: 50S ribosomal protein L5 [Candidatus Wolfebacteria bacterium CG10_big_fil_rev_8_21_14_0_10_31_9]